MNVPTLHEIAAMPYPQSVHAMRKHYAPDWGLPVPEGRDGKAAFKVSIDYTVTRFGSAMIEVEAWTESEAEDLAIQEISNQQCYDGDDLETTWVEVKLIKEAQQ